MADNTQDKKEDILENSVKNKKEWVTPDVSDYGYATITEGGALTMGVDDTMGANYSLS